MKQFHISSRFDLMSFLSGHHHNHRRNVWRGPGQHQWGKKVKKKKVCLIYSSIRVYLQSYMMVFGLFL